VVGGDAIDSRLLVGEGNSADATIARDYPADMRRLIFSTFADINEWTASNVPQDEQPPLIADWKLMYQSSLVTTNAPNPEYNGLMIYDAVGVLVYAVKWAQGTFTGDAVRNALVSLGKDKVPAYQGFSGKITFDNNGDPVNKAIVVLTIQDNGYGNQIVLQQVIGAFQ
jgi:ABC-type branched-subunit amino acid transport system substrate-binding protein